MALSSMAAQIPSNSHSPATASGNGASKPPMKQIKRTRFPDWDDEQPSAKRTSITPVPVPVPASTTMGPRLAASKAVQAVQQQWAQQREDAQVVTDLGADDTESEYVTSGEDESEEESEDDLLRDNFTPDRLNDDGPANSHQHLSANELEAKIRSDTHRARQGLDSSNDAPEADSSRDLLEMRGANGALMTTLDGRMYSKLHTEWGETLHTGTLPIPTNYQLLDTARNSFVCPVRDCQKMGGSIGFLTGHFSACHNRSTFNDNLDGTLSKVGSYVAAPGMTSPGIVVSRNPPPADIAPPVAPRVAFSVMKAAVTPRKFIDHQALARQTVFYSLPSPAQSAPSALPAPQEPRRSAPIEYLNDLLDSRQVVPKRADIQNLASLPRKRDLPRAWIDHHSGTILDKTHYSCALAYIVGHEIRKEACTAPLTSTSRLSKPSICVPLEMPDVARAEFSKCTTCVGCRYWSHLQRQRNKCSWNVHGMRDSVSEGRSESVDMDWSSANQDNEERESPVPLPSATAPKPSRRTGTVSAAQAGSGLRYSTSFSKEEREPAAAEPEMEDWEFAPGRLLNDKEPAQNVAFSNSYLTSREPVMVSDDISFNVAILSSGTTIHLAVEETKLRTCSVATGKVKVTVSGTEFKIGPHGMFKVMPGESCTVENRQYTDAYIHCTTVDNYEVTSG